MSSSNCSVVPGMPYKSDDLVGHRTEYLGISHGCVKTAVEAVLPGIAARLTIVVRARSGGFDPLSITDATLILYPCLVLASCCTCAPKRPMPLE